MSLAGCPSYEPGPDDNQLPPQVKAAIEVRETGVESCETRDLRPGNEVLKSTRVLSVYVEGPAERILFKPCAGFARIVTRLPPVKFQLPASSEPANFVEIQNLTTCTTHQAALENDQFLIAAKVLPVGSKVKHAPGEFALDPKRVNLIQVAYRDCHKLARTSGGAVYCARSTVRQERTVLLSLVYDGRPQGGPYLKSIECGSER